MKPLANHSCNCRLAFACSWILSLAISFTLGGLINDCAVPTAQRRFIDVARDAVSKSLLSVGATPLAFSAFSDVAHPTGSTTPTTSVSQRKPLKSGAPIVGVSDASTRSRSATNLVQTSSHSPAASHPQTVSTVECIDVHATAPYHWAHAIPVDPLLAAARQTITRPTDEELKDTAIVTMATGDAAARGATALMQSLIDSGTRVPTLLVLIFRGGTGSTWCASEERRIARRGKEGGHALSCK
jgi:hypothetical protein